MNHREIKSTGVIDAYVGGSLSAQDTARFEEHMLDCESCQDELELALTLRDGLRELERDGKSAVEGTSEQVSTSLARSASRGARWWGLAAAGLALVAASSLLMNSRQGARIADLETEVAELNERDMPVLRNLTLVPVDVLRSSDTTSAHARISSSRSEAAVFLLRLPPSALEESAEVRVVVAQHEMPVLEVVRLRPSAEAEVSFALSTTTLAPGEYQLVVYSEATGAELVRYRVLVTD